MLKSVEGIYQDGKILLAEAPGNMPEATRVIVTFLDAATRGVDLHARGIDEVEATELRARLSVIADDWNSPEMDLYDDYEASKAALQAG